ncbi:hypothetical protein AAF463_23515 (plasmid) [Pantoea sp. BJ2]|uniref:Dilute domain-containing protein n=1 Tax=Pantoea sp. BJ2 TaxID=3141322 RepID=A0AAU7U3T6_9GAMM
MLSEHQTRQLADNSQVDARLENEFKLLQRLTPRAPVLATFMPTSDPLTSPTLASAACSALLKSFIQKVFHHILQELQLEALQKFIQPVCRSIIT